MKTVSLVGKKALGKRNVYDIEVAEHHNFFANGINVHNCATAGGVSVIQNTGTVVNSANTGSFAHVAIRESDKSMVADIGAGGQSFYAFRNIGSLAVGFPLGTAYSSVSIPPALTANNGTSASLGYATARIARGAFASSASLLSIIAENPAAPAKGMVAYLTTAYNTGWMVGDMRGCWLADTVAETITGSGELVTNGTFDTDTSGWASASAAPSTAAAVGGEMQVTASVNFGGQLTSFSTVIGRSYRLSGAARLVSGTGAAQFCVADSVGNGSINSISISSATATTISLDFVASSTTTYIKAQVNISGAVGGFDNISVKLATPDRSVKNKGAVVVGSLTKTAVASGANLVGFSGFSASNYLEQPYNSDLDFGTGDFCYQAWLDGTFNGTILSRGAAVAGAILLKNNATTGIFEFFIHNGSGYQAAGATPVLTGVGLLTIKRTGAAIEIWWRDQLAISATSALTVTCANSVLRVGERQDTTGPFQGRIALLRASATVPSSDQIAQIYRDELALFQPGAQCTLDGTSSAVTALAYDDSTELLHVGTSWGRTALHGLVRVESTATSVGAVQSIAAGGGSHLTAGATAGRFTQPALTLRDELRRKAEAKAAAGREILTLDVDFIAAQTTYTLPYGYTTKNVWAAGAPKRLGSTKDYLVSTDGYRETITFNVSPGAVWVRIDMTRSI